MQATPEPSSLPMPQGSDVVSTAFYALLIVALAVLLGLVALAVRKKLTQPGEADASAGMGFTLADLRRMHDAGEIDDAEFARAKAKMLAHARAGLGDDDEDLADGELHLEGDPRGRDHASDDFAGFDDRDDDDMPR